MKREIEATAVELAIGPHAARRGWEVARIVYDPARPEHLRQVEAAISALVRARSRQERRALDSGDANASAGRTAP